MKKQKLLPCVLWLLLFVAGMFLLAGCQDQAGDTGGNNGEETGAVQPGEPAPEEELLEYDWTIAVDDEVVLNKGSRVCLQSFLNAVKEGGIDTMGEYRGTALLTVSADLSTFNLPPDMPVQLTGNVAGEGKDDDASFTVVSYDPEKIEWPPTIDGEPRVASLVEQNGMAYGAFNMAGWASIDILAQGFPGSMGHDDTTTLVSPVGFAILIGRQCGSVYRLYRPAFQRDSHRVTALKLSRGITCHVKGTE